MVFQRFLSFFLKNLKNAKNRTVPSVLFPASVLSLKYLSENRRDSLTLFPKKFYGLPGFLQTAFVKPPHDKLR